MKILFSCLAFLAAVATVRGDCITDLSTICDGIKCSPLKDCNVKVCDPCDGKKFYTCASQDGISGIYLVSETPEICPCGLNCSNEFRGCTILTDEPCTTEKPYKGPTVTYTVQPGSGNDFCIDWDDPALTKGIWIDRLYELPTAVGKHGLGGHFDGSQWLSLLYFANNQRAKFTWHGWFKRDSYHGGLQGIVSNGNDKHPGSMDITSFGTLDLGLLTGSISTEPSHMISSISVSKTHLDGDWHFFAFVYNRTHITIDIDGSEVHQVVAEPGFTDRNDCPLSIGRYVDSVNNEYFFIGDLDEVCFYSVALSKTQLDTIRAGGDYPAHV